MTDPTSTKDANATVKQVAKQAEAVKQSATHIKASAKAVEQSAVELTDSADRRTVLASDRTVLASERTFAAWVRTGLMALGGGVGANAFVAQGIPRWLVIAVASIMLVFAMFCFAAAVWRNLQQRPPPKADVPELPRLPLIGFSALLIVATAAILITILMAAIQGG